MIKTQLSIYNFHKKHGFPTNLPIKANKGYPRLMLILLCKVVLLVSKICLWHSKKYRYTNKRLMEVFYRFHFISEELVETILPLNDGDIHKTCDGLGDLIYVVIGSAVSFGLPVKEIIDEVCRSNDTKSPRNKTDNFRLKNKGKNFEEPNFIIPLKEGKKRLVSEGQI